MRPDTGVGALSQRELDVVALVAEALSNIEIALRLGISDRTVQAHVGSACRKTGTRSRTHLAVHALRTGLVAWRREVPPLDEAAEQPNQDPSGAEAVDPLATNEHQPLLALAGANRVRRARAALKRRIRDGELNASEVIRAVPGEARTMTVSSLLLSHKGWGEKRARRILRTADVAWDKEIGALTERQRSIMAAVLEDHEAAGRPRR